MEQVSEAGRGVVVLIRENRPTAVSERIRDLIAGKRAEPALRDYGIGAQILIDLGVKDMILLSNHKRTIIGLEGYGLNVVEQRAIEGIEVKMSTADAPAPIAPKLAGPAPKILIVSAPYYQHVVNGMLAAARDILAQAECRGDARRGLRRVSNCRRRIAIALKGGQKFDGYIALGCVVRGETDHYEFICSSAMSGLMQLAVDQAICLGTAVLTVDTLAQAVARSHETGSNKGAEAAIACLKQIAIARQFAA